MMAAPRAMPALPVNSEQIAHTTTSVIRPSSQLSRNRGTGMSAATTRKPAAVAGGR